MTISTLDERTALITIDLQRGIVSLDTAHPARDVVARSAELARGFREAGMPVVLVNVTGGAPGRTESRRSLADRPDDWAELVPELARAPDDRTVTKQRWGAFEGTDLESQLRELEVTNVVLTGISTSIGVESTARSAYERGFNVSLAVDAMTDSELAAHTNSVERIFPRLGETGTAAEILGVLGQR